MEELLQALRAAGESTRLRILAVLDRSELTVGELCRVLGQTQPRVSRHLKLMCDAGLLQRHAQGTRAYFRPARAGQGRELFDALRPLIDPDDAVLARDLQRLAGIRQERAAAAAEYFEAVAATWDRMRDLHVADDEVEAALLEAVEDLHVRDLLDVGTGTGRILEVFADRIERGVGLDLSRQMLDLARSRLDQAGLRHCNVRHGNAYDLPVEAGAFDVAVVHHVLHFLDDPASAVHEAARSLRAGGRLLVVDFAPHRNESFLDDHSHHWLGFDDDEVASWCRDAGLVDVELRHLHPDTPASGDQEPLTTTIWSATQRADAPSLHDLKAVS